MSKDNKIYFRVEPSVLEWWEKKCKAEGVKKGEPFQKALEAEYLKAHSKNTSDQSDVFTLESSLKEKLIEEAKSVGKSTSQLLNEILSTRYLEKKHDEINVFEKTIRKEIRLKPSLLKKIDEAASAEKMRPNQYIVSVLTAKLTHNTFFFGNEEAKLLGESNSQLLAIGRNLNQMAKNMNQDIYEAYDRNFVIQVHDEIKEHVRAVFYLLENNKKRWE